MIVAEQRIDDLIKALEDAASSILLPENYRPLGPMSERHGGWQITFQRADGPEQLVRSITLNVSQSSDLLSQSVDPFRKRWLLEVQLGVTNGHYRLLQRLASLSISLSDFPYWLRWIHLTLSFAASDIERITKADLCQSNPYVETSANSPVRSTNA